MFYFAELVSLLKLTLWGSITSILILEHKTVRKGVNKLIDLTKKSEKKLIPFEIGGHTGVIATTRNSKTYSTLQSLVPVKEGVFLLNIDEEETPSNFIYANSNSDLSLILRMLDQGKKIDYHLSIDQPQKEFDFIIDFLFKVRSIGSKDFYLVVEEIHSYKTSSNIHNINKLFTKGIKRGINVIWNTQKGTLTNKEIFSMSHNFVFLNVAGDEAYYDQYIDTFKNKSNPVTKMQELIKKFPHKFVYKGKTKNASYCLYDGEKIQGVFHV